jgi:DNA-binding response OmpR family regulator
VTIDVPARRVTVDDTVVHLTPTEFDLLLHLTSHAGRVCTRTELLSEVWGYADGWGGRTIDSHVKALRRKLGPDVVRTIHGVGYSAGDPNGAAA